MANSTNSATTITALHSDIIQSHILTRLDGPTLASTSSSTSHLRSLCTQNPLWREICTATWPSLQQPLADSLISTFPTAHRSIFSDSFPSLHDSPLPHKLPPSPPPPELISAVDLYYKGKPVLSRVIRTETEKSWFLTSPLWIDLLETNEMVQTPVKLAPNVEDREWLNHVEENLTLSWIVINPANQRAANLSSRFPVSVRRHWFTGELEILYAVAMGAVQWTVKVTCCGKAGGEMHVREVSLAMEDADGRHVIGGECMMVLQAAMEGGKRRKVVAEEAKKSFERFCLVKRERRERRLKREKALDMSVMLVSFAVVFTLLFRLVTYWA